MTQQQKAKELHDAAMDLIMIGDRYVSLNKLRNKLRMAMPWQMVKSTYQAALLLEQQGIELLPEGEWRIILVNSLENIKSRINGIA
jgi:hypothetical protein